MVDLWTPTDAARRGNSQLQPTVRRLDRPPTRPRQPVHRGAGSRGPCRSCKFAPTSGRGDRAAALVSGVTESLLDNDEGLLPLDEGDLLITGVGTTLGHIDDWMTRNHVFAVA